jgi:hypothetical protein
MYFYPQPLESDGHHGIQAAQFRGRGLLAKPVSANGQVIVVTSNKMQNVSIFDKVTEWQHVHQPASVTSSSSRISRVEDWYEVALALHAPVDSTERA